MKIGRSTIFALVIVLPVLLYGFSDTVLVSIAPLDTPEVLAYFPLRIGNKWQYAVYTVGVKFPHFSHYQMVEVLYDTVLPNGKKYFYLNAFGQYDNDYGYFRIDTTELKVYNYNPYYGWGSSACVDSEVVYFDLNLIGSNGSYNTCAEYPVQYESGREFFNLMSDSVNYMSYSWFTGLVYFFKIFDGIGIQEWIIEELGGFQGRLIAAEINGTQYGEFIIEPTGYFPTSIGNHWTYVSQPDTLTETIVDTQGINGELYYRFDRFRDITDFLYRVNGDQVLVYRDTTEVLWYDFSAQVGDSWEIADPFEGGTMSLLSNTDTIVTPIGTHINCYRFHHFIADDYEFDEWFAPDVGLIQRDYITIAGPRRWTLSSTNVLAIIDGARNQIPEFFYLSQNYPNPFNAYTSIQIYIPKRSLVTLTVYDILGREVKTISNRFLEVGTHQIRWDGSNFTSGVYFITMKAGDVIKIRKAILLK